MIFKKVREVARQNLKKARKKPRGNITKKEFRHAPIRPRGDSRPIRRPKGWKLGAKWIGPFEIVCRMVLITK
jgi:hypothetical protein